MRVCLLGIGVAMAGVARAEPPKSAREKSARDQYQRAAQLDDAGDSQKALELIEQGLAIAPKDLKLLGLKGTVLLKLRDYAGALAAYQAYLEAGATGANRREAQKIVDLLGTVKSTFLEIALANGPAEVYLDSKTQGLFCTAQPSCQRPMLPGAYKVIVERPGFERWTGNVTVERDQTAKVAVTLVELPSQLTVHAEPPGARITVDGAAYEAPLQVAAGTHRVVVSLEGHTEDQREVAAHEGKPVELAVTLAAVPPPAPVPVPPPVARPAEAPSRFTTRRKLALAAGGAGVVALGAGVALGLSARGLDDDSYGLCPSPTMPCSDARRADLLNRQARSRALEANIAYGVAGAAAAAAAVLWLTGAPESRVAVTARLGAVSGIDLAVRF